MNKRNIFCLIITFAVFFGVQMQSFAASSIPQIKTKTEINIEKDDKTHTEAEIIKRVSLKNKFQKSPEEQINSFLKKYNQYSEKNKFDKLKEMYCEDFVNNDGFDRETFFKMLEAASSSYKNTKYKSTIDKIEINGKYATVKVRETATAETEKSSARLKDTGFVESYVDYTDYLVKDGNNWKIQATDVHSEETTMKFGEAKGMKIEIITPAVVPAGSKYEVTVNANTPDGSFALGSIVNEPIVFPQKDGEDVFRAIKDEKLARVLTANKNNNNEYTTVSIALTRAEVDPLTVNINMTGMAFAMKRINVIPFSQVKEANSEIQNSK